MKAKLGLAVCWLFLQTCFCSECNPLSTFSYYETFKNMESCIGGPSLDISISTISNVIGASIGTVALTCDNVTSCTTLIKTYADDPTTNSIIKGIATKLSTDPAASCACLGVAVSKLDDCSPMLDKINTNFCLRFYSASSNSNSTISSTPSPSKMPSFIPAPVLAPIPAPATNPAPAPAPATVVPKSPPTITDSPDICGAAITRTCAFTTTPPSFNETISCIRKNVANLQSECSLLLDVFIAGIYRGCAVDIVSKCQTSFSINSPARVMSCLAWNFKDLSSSCRSQLEDLAGSVIPCARESATYCSDKYLPEEVFTCLESVSSDTFDPICKDMVVGFHQCKGEYSDDDASSSSEPPSAKSKPGPGKGKGKQKPSPGSTDDASEPPRSSHSPRHLSHTAASSTSTMSQLRRRAQSDSKTKPKPRPGQNGAGIKPKNKPRPGDEDSPNSDEGPDSPSGNLGEKKNAKQKPCWQRHGDSRDSNGPEDPENNIGSDDPAEQHSLENGFDDGPPPGSPLPILFGLVVILVVFFCCRYREKVQSLCGGQSDVHQPAGFPSATVVEMSTYVRAPAEDTDIDSSSHPLSKEQEPTKNPIVVAAASVSC